jgi:hypothetical protein
VGRISKLHENKNQSKKKRGSEEESRNTSEEEVEIWSEEVAPYTPAPHALRPTHAHTRNSPQP